MKKPKDITKKISYNTVRSNQTLGGFLKDEVKVQDAT